MTKKILKWLLGLCALGFVTLFIVLSFVTFKLNRHISDGLENKTKIAAHLNGIRNYGDVPSPLLAGEYVPYKELPISVVRLVNEYAKDWPMDYLAAREITRWRHVGSGMLSWHLSGFIYMKLVELRLSRDEMVEIYLNRAYYGKSNEKDVYGLSAASEAYLAKPLKQIKDERDAGELLGHLWRPHE